MLSIVYGQLHAQACWKLATVIKADLNMQIGRKSNFRYLENGIQSAWIVSTFFPSWSRLLGSPDFLFSSSQGPVKVGIISRPRLRGSFSSRMLKCSLRVLAVASFRLLRVAEYRILLLENKVLFAYWSEFSNISTSSGRKIKIIRSISNRKWMSTVVNDVDSWREASYVKASSVATSRCSVVDTVPCDHRWRTSSLFVDVVRRRWQTSWSYQHCRRRRSPPWLTAVIVGRRCGEEQFHYCWRRLPGFRLVVLSVSITMANPSLGDTYSTLHSVSTVATPGSALVPEPSSNLPSRAPPWLSLVWS